MQLILWIYNRDKLLYHDASIMVIDIIAKSLLGVTIQWTGLLDWTTGLDYWTDIFLVFVHSVVGFMESC